MIPLPAYIDPEAWAGFVEMRKASGRTRPFTYRAAVLVLYELQRLKDAGHCPNAALDQSTRLGWADVYPPKQKDILRAPAVGTGELDRINAHIVATSTPDAKRAADAAREAANIRRSIDAAGLSPSPTLRKVA